MAKQKQTENEVKAAICQRILKGENAIIYIDINGIVGDNNSGNAITQVGGNVGGNVTTSPMNERLISVIEAQQREISELREIINKLMSNTKYLDK